MASESFSALSSPSPSRRNYSRWFGLGLIFVFVFMIQFLDFNIMNRITEVNNLREPLYRRKTKVVENEEDMMFVKREEHDYYTQHVLSMKEDPLKIRSLVEEIKRLSRQYDSKAYDSKGGFHSILEEERKKDAEVVKARKEGNEERAKKIEQEHKAKLQAKKSQKVEKKYRAIICAIVRNDFHMREFVVRNLLQGFNHIVLYDNNHIGRGIDHNITSLLQAFVDEDMVTLVPFQQSTDSKYLKNDLKNGNSETCINTYGIYADWVIAMDTDEVIYIRNTEANIVGEEDGSSLDPILGSESHSVSGTSIGQLQTFLDDVENILPKTCALSLPWRMMDGNHTVLSYPDKLLIDQFTRVCKIHDATKILLKPDFSETTRMPHFTRCIGGGFTDQYRTDDPNFLEKKMKGKYIIHNVHYYAKSVEEFINKSEQSIPPYIRLLKDAYDKVRKCIGTEVVYDTPYKETVHRIMKGLKVSQGQLPDAGDFLGPLPEFKANAIDDYAMYLFFKTRVTLRDEWDEEQYLLKHEDVANAVERRLFIDGLQHYLEDGFDAGYSSCWIRQGGELDSSFFTTHLHQKKSFCID